MSPLRYTYDEKADAAYIYFEDDRTPGRVSSGDVVAIPFDGAAFLVDVDASGRALGMEILGVSRIFTASALGAMRKGRTPFEGS